MVQSPHTWLTHADESLSLTWTIQPLERGRSNHGPALAPNTGSGTHKRESFARWATNSHDALNRGMRVHLEARPSDADWITRLGGKG